MRRALFLRSDAILAAVVFLALWQWKTRRVLENTSQHDQCGDRCDSNNQCLDETPAILIHVPITRARQQHVKQRREQWLLLFYGKLLYWEGRKASRNSPGCRRDLSISVEHFEAANAQRVFSHSKGSRDPCLVEDGALLTARSLRRSLRVPPAVLPDSPSIRDHLMNTY